MTHHPSLPIPPTQAPESPWVPHQRWTPQWLRADSIAESPATPVQYLHLYSHRLTSARTLPTAKEMGEITPPAFHSEGELPPDRAVPPTPARLHNDALRAYYHPRPLRVRSSSVGRIAPTVRQTLVKAELSTPALTTSLGEGLSPKCRVTLLRLALKWNELQQIELFERILPHEMIVALRNNVVPPHMRLHLTRTKDFLLVPSQATSVTNPDGSNQIVPVAAMVPFYHDSQMRIHTARDTHFVSGDPSMHHAASDAPRRTHARQHRLDICLHLPEVPLLLSRCFDAPVWESRSDLPTEAEGCVVRYLDGQAYLTERYNEVRKEGVRMGRMLKAGEWPTPWPAVHEERNLVLSAAAHEVPRGRMVDWLAGEWVRERFEGGNAPWLRSLVERRP